MIKLFVKELNWDVNILVIFIGIMICIFECYSKDWKCLSVKLSENVLEIVCILL